MKKTAIILQILMFATSLSLADTLYFKNGHSVQGEIIEETEETMTIKQSMGTYGSVISSYKKTDIERIEKTSELDKMSLENRRETEASKAQSENIFFDYVVKNLLDSEEELLDIIRNRRYYDKKQGKAVVFTQEEINSLRRALCNRYYPDWSEDVKTDIEKGVIRLGMTKKQVITAWGKPDKVNTDTGPWGVHKQIIYGDIYLYFQNDILTSWQEHKDY